jgi:hypothetical protein
MRLTGIQRDLIRSAHVILLCALCLASVSGQESHLEDQKAPPPLKVMSTRERAQVNEAKDPKARVKLTLELAEAHIANAELRTSQSEFDTAAAEAGMYWALIDDLFDYLGAIKKDNDKTRDLYKRLELSLRAHGPKFAMMRRGTPAEHAVWIKEVEEFTRKGRTDALNNFYGQTVIRDGSPKPLEHKDPEKPLRETKLVPPKSNE